MHEDQWIERARQRLRERARSSDIAVSRNAHRILPAAIALAGVDAPRHRRAGCRPCAAAQCYLSRHSQASAVTSTRAEPNRPLPGRA